MYTGAYNRDKLCRYLILGYIVLFACVFGFALVGQATGITKITKMALHFYAMNSPIIVAISVLMFMLFKAIDIGYIGFINKVAATTFGIYLIHDNPFVRPFLWQTLFQNPERSGSEWLILYGIGEVAAVFIVCSLIDWLRITCFEKRLFAYANPVLDRMEARIQDRWERHFKDL